MFKAVASRSLSLIVAALSLTLLAAAPAVTVSDAHIPAGPPDSDMLAAYFTVKNASTQPLILIGADSEAFDSVTLHRTTQMGGMAGMTGQDKIEIPAGGELRLAPGGYHLMLMGPKRTLKPGDSVRFRLRFANHSPVDFSAKVTR